jgi:intein-encoded DNA endonuclease-like protein
MPMHRTLNHDFFSEWSTDMAYVLGYFAADGSMIKNNRDAYYIEFTSTDRILIEHVQKVTGSTHHVSPRERGANCQTAYRIQIGSKQWFEDLTGLGFTQKKSLTMQFPEISSKYFGHFVRGYFDGDGCAYLKEHWAKDRNHFRWVFTTRFTSGSYSFLETLLGRLREYEVQGGRIVTKQKGSYDLVFSWNDSVALYRLMYHTAPISNLYLPRKREKIERAIQVLGLKI